MLYRKTELGILKLERKLMTLVGRFFVLLLMLVIVFSPALTVYGAEDVPLPEPVISESPPEEESETAEAEPEEPSPDEESNDAETKNEAESSAGFGGDETLEESVEASIPDENTEVPETQEVGETRAADTKPVSETEGGTETAEVVISEVSDIGTATKSTTTAVEQGEAEAAATTTDNVVESDQSESGEGGSSGSVLGTATKTDASDVLGTSTESEAHATTTKIVESTPEETDNEAASTTEVGGEPVDNDITTTPESTEEIVETEEQATTTVPEETGPGYAYAISDANKFQFSKDECVAAGVGMYYCTNNSGETALPNDNVYAKVDVEGDREIYALRGGTEIQITDNQTDDNAPYYDDISETIVWHRLIDGRYQVIEYSFESGEERQITTERYNNMQPSRYGNTIVWQGWVGSDWEIMLEESGEFTMLTDNTTHDISPTINGSHIVWQSFEDEAWKVKVYDTVSGSINTIADADGGSIENPRFVLVYDTKFDNGDIETKGYDVKSGEVVPLTSEPVPLPEEIPDAEPTGEERALVQPTVQVKPKSEGEADSDDDIVPLDPIDDTASSTTSVATSTSDVVIPPLLETVDETATSTEEVATTIENLVVPLHEEPEAVVENTEPIATSTESIDDLIITPFVEPIEVSTDSQEGVATST